MMSKITDIYFVGRRNGKVQKGYLPVIDEVFNNLGFGFHYFPKLSSFTEALLSGSLVLDETSIVILIYSEQVLVEDRGIQIKKELQDLMCLLESFPQVKVVHPLWVGQILTDKIATNKVFTSNNVPCPELIIGKTSPKLVFQNKVYDNHGRGSRLVVQGEIIDSTKYNTEFIDTIFNYKNQKYYSNIRLTCAGKEISNIVVRLRDVNEGNPTIHNSTMCADCGLINQYYNSRVIPILEHLKITAEKIYEIFGLGFYVHDIIIDQGGNHFVTESGFKIGNPGYANHIRPVKEKVNPEILTDGDAIVKRQILTFINQLNCGERKW